VKRKVEALITPKHLSIRPVLVHVNGVAEPVLEGHTQSELARMVQQFGVIDPHPRE
jgi:hypothetical protein